MGCSVACLSSSLMDEGIMAPGRPSSNAIPPSPADLRRERFAADLPALPVSAPDREVGAANLGRLAVLAPRLAPATVLGNDVAAHGCTRREAHGDIAQPELGA